MERGADIDKVNDKRNKNLTALEAACHAEDIRLAIELLKLGADLVRPFQSLCLKRAPVEPAIFEILLEHIDVTGPRGTELLVSASRNGQLEAARLLLEKGVNPNLTDTHPGFAWMRR
jgi:ankyrin repeat protein